MPSNSTLLSAAELVSALSAEKEDSAALHHIKKNLCVAIVQLLLPAALRAAAGGNVYMREAVLSAWPYIKKFTSK